MSKKSTVIEDAAFESKGVFDMDANADASAKIGNTGKAKADNKLAVSAFLGSWRHNHLADDAFLHWLRLRKPSIRKTTSDAWRDLWHEFLKAAIVE